MSSSSSPWRAASLVLALTASASAQDAAWIDAPAERWATRSLAVTPRTCTHRSELRLDASVTDELAVSPTGHVWLVDGDGAGYVSSAIEAGWSPTALDCRESDHDRCERVSFVNADVAIATGYLGDRRDGYVRTTDGGRTWERRSFGDGTFAAGAWIYDVFTTPEGHVWMGGSNGRLLHSADAGLTFTVASAPFDGSSRLARLHVRGSHVLAGALRNALRFSEDGGHTWTDIATPMDQGFENRAARADPRIEEVGLFGASWLVQQGEQVFVTPAGSGPPRWRMLPLAHVAVDRTSTRAFGVDARGRIHRLVLDVSGAVRLARTSAVIRRAVLDLEVEGDTLHVLDEGMMVHRLDGAAFVSAAPTSDDRFPRSLEVVRRAGERLWGISRHALYSSTDGGATFCREGTAAPEGLVGLAPRSDAEILVWGEEGAWMFEVARGRWRQVLDGAVSRVVVDGGTRRALVHRGEGTELVLSTDGGARWEQVDRWEGGAAELVALGRETLVWRATAVRWVRADVAPRWQALDPRVEVPCCVVGYRADELVAYVRGYVHHAGELTWLTSDGGASWTAQRGETFPYRLVVPFGDGALAMEGGSFDYDEDRALVLLRGRTRRLIHRGQTYIRDVSVGPSGEVLLELDDEPQTRDDARGRRWLALEPAVTDREAR